VGAWPISSERLLAYGLKAAREAAESTGWQHPDLEFEKAIESLANAANGDARAILEGFVAEIVDHGRVNSLSAKLLQLAAPGVPDVYQGTELWDHSLVDPDNRRPVDFAERSAMLRRLDEDVARGVLPPVDDSGLAKMLVTSRSLRLRRDNRELFYRYRPGGVAGEASDHAVAMDRGGVLAVATRLPAGLARRGGWGDTVLLRRELPATDAITGRRFDRGSIRLADLLDTYPVALLVDER